MPDNWDTLREVIGKVDFGVRKDIQPEPTPHGGTGDVMMEVIADIAARIEHGETKYGQRVRAYNGRNALRDAYQEALDLTVYLKQKLMEEGTPHRIGGYAGGPK